jgi:hypothetical protein
MIGYGRVKGALVHSDLAQPRTYGYSHLLMDGVPAPEGLLASQLAVEQTTKAGEPQFVPGLIA